MSSKLNAQAVADKIANIAVKTNLTPDSIPNSDQQKIIVLAATVLVNKEKLKMCDTNKSFFDNFNCLTPQQKRLYVFVKTPRNNVFKGSRNVGFQEIFDSIRNDIFKECKYTEESKYCPSVNSQNVDNDLFNQLGLSDAMEQVKFIREVWTKYSASFKTIKIENLKIAQESLMNSFNKKFSNNDLENLKTSDVFQRLSAKFPNIERNTLYENFLQNPVFEFDKNSLQHYENLINSSEQYLQNFIAEFNNSGYSPDNEEVSMVFKIMDLLNKHDKAMAQEEANAKAEKERIEKERIEKERIDKERIEKERIDKERIEKERIEEEDKKRKAAEEKIKIESAKNTQLVAKIKKQISTLEKITDITDLPSIADENFKKYWSEISKDSPDDNTIVTLYKPAYENIKTYVLQTFYGIDDESRRNQLNKTFKSFLFLCNMLEFMHANPQTGRKYIDIYKNLKIFETQENITEIDNNNVKSEFFKYLRLSLMGGLDKTEQNLINRMT